MADSLIHIAITQSDGVNSTLYLCLDVANSFDTINTMYTICLAGAIPFPQWPFLVFAISLAGVVVGPLLVYSFLFFGGYDRLLVDKCPQKIAI